MFPNGHLLFLFSWMGYSFLLYSLIFVTIYLFLFLFFLVCLDPMKFSLSDLKMRRELIFLIYSRLLSGQRRTKQKQTFSVSFRDHFFNGS